MSARLPRLDPTELDDRQRALYRAIVDGPRAAMPGATMLVDADGTLRGPFNAYLYAPAVGGHLEALGLALRFQGVLRERSREAAILMVAAQHCSEYEWKVHERAARNAGLSATDVENIRAGIPHDALSDEEQLACRTTQRLLADGSLTDGDFERARAGLGVPALVELCTLVGFYSLLALQLRVFQIDD